jgi:hypothetical protein
MSRRRAGCSLFTTTTTSAATTTTKVPRASEDSFTCRGEEGEKAFRQIKTSKRTSWALYPITSDMPTSTEKVQVDLIRDLRLS